MTKFLLSETHQRHIRDPSETDMPDRRPIGDRHASSLTSTCFIVDIDMLHRGDPSETDMPQYIIPIYMYK